MTCQISKVSTRKCRNKVGALRHTGKAFVGLCQKHDAASGSTIGKRVVNVSAPGTLDDRDIDAAIAKYVPA